MVAFAPIWHKRPGRQARHGPAPQITLNYRLEQHPACPVSRGPATKQPRPDLRNPRLHRIDDEVEVTTPSGDRYYTIEGLEFI